MSETGCTYRSHLARLQRTAGQTVEHSRAVHQEGVSEQRKVGVDVTSPDIELFEVSVHYTRQGVVDEALGSDVLVVEDRRGQALLGSLVYGDQLVGGRVADVARSDMVGARIAGEGWSDQYGKEGRHSGRTFG